MMLIFSNFKYSELNVCLNIAGWCWIKLFWNMANIQWKYFEMLRISERNIFKCCKNRNILKFYKNLRELFWNVTKRNICLQEDFQWVGRKLLWHFGPSRSGEKTGQQAKFFFKNLKKTFLEWRENRAASKKKFFKT